MTTHNKKTDTHHADSKHCLPVCLSIGGGNAAHVAAGMYSHRGAKVNMFLSDAREVQQWQQHLKEGIEVHRRYEGDIYKGMHAYSSSKFTPWIFPRLTVTLRQKHSLWHTAALTVLFLDLSAALRRSYRHCISCQH